MDNTFKKKFIGLDLISNPKKTRSNSNINRDPIEESKEFIEAKELLINKIKRIKEKDLDFKPNEEIDITIHTLFAYMLYKPYINDIYNNIKQKGD